MPVWNARATLGEAAGSVLAQSMADWELLLIDDGSTDGSRELAEGFAARDGRVGVLGDAVNRGPAAARNEGIRAARGRRIAFLDADDLLAAAEARGADRLHGAHGRALHLHGARPDRRGGAAGWARSARRRGWITRGS